MSKQCVISVKEEAVLVREVKTIILNSSYDVKDYCKGLLQITMGVCFIPIFWGKYGKSLKPSYTFSSSTMCMKIFCTFSYFPEFVGKFPALFRIFQNL